MSLLLIFTKNENRVQHLLPILQKHYQTAILEQGDPINTLVAPEFPRAVLYCSSFSDCEDFSDDLDTLRTIYPMTPVIFIHDLDNRLKHADELEQKAALVLRKPPPPSMIAGVLRNSIHKFKQNQNLILAPEHIDLETQNLSSAKMQRIMRICKKVSPTDATILITGESGTGKEVLAQWIHNHSLRKEKPFIAINCGAITETILESELFGHKRGSFTGAEQDKIGLFEAAHSGTIFLDEIGEMPYALQVKLLRVLQERKIRRVGDVESIPVDVRIIAATNKELEKLVISKEFREDLYYRLKVVHVNLPPLRERREALHTLTDQFLTLFAQKYNKPVLEIAPSTRNILMNYAYPGNIRELQNIIEYAVIMCESRFLQPQDLPFELQKGSPMNLLPAPVEKAAENFSSLHDFLKAYFGLEEPTLTDIEYLIIVERLRNYHDNQKMVAESLGISRTSLWRKLKDFQVDPKQLPDLKLNPLPNKEDS
jgi:transcriptional regulator with PAS, ATPase and Fis domain